MQTKTIVVLGTGGTIAGRASSSQDNTGYAAGTITVADLVSAIPLLSTYPLEFEQVAQLDSKDMDHATWHRLAQRVAHHQSRDDVQGVVITHGTDTLEETAYFLSRVITGRKPVVMTAAMRPATSLQADGPQNLVDAVGVAQAPGVTGVVVLMAGRVHSAVDVRKAHAYQLDAFSSAERGPIALIEEGRLVQLRTWPETSGALGLDRLQSDPEKWPRVELIWSYAGSDGAIVTALVNSGLRGLVVAGCGNGNVHHKLQEALFEAQRGGVTVWRSTRCGQGSVVSHEQNTTPLASKPVLPTTALSAVKARIELMLALMSGE